MVEIRTVWEVHGSRVAEAPGELFRQIIVFFPRLFVLPAGCSGAQKANKRRGTNISVYHIAERRQSKV